MCSVGRRHRFAIGLDPIPDGLVRILGPFAGRQVILLAARYDHRGDDGRGVLETTGLSPAQADHIALRLAEMPWVRNLDVQELGPVLEVAVSARPGAIDR